MPKDEDPPGSSVMPLPSSDSPVTSSEAAGKPPDPVGLGDVAIGSSFVLGGVLGGVLAYSAPPGGAP